MKQYPLTLLFIATALVAIVFAAVTVNRIIGGLAEENLIRTAEENTARDALHMQAMIRRGHGMSSATATAVGDGMQGMQIPTRLNLDPLTVPEGLSRTLPALVEGLSIVKLNLFDLYGTTVWSTDPNSIGITKRESTLFREAVTGKFSSKLAKDHAVVHLEGVARRIDVVETYVPLRETREGNIIGVMELYRDISGDVALQVDDAKSAALRTTVGTMGGLFLVLLGFIVVAFRLHALYALIKGRTTREEYHAAASIHTIPVMLLALVPGFGAIAYAASATMMKKGLGRMLIRRSASRLPFGLYCRHRLARLTAPRPQKPRSITTLTAPLPVAGRC